MRAIPDFKGPRIDLNHHCHGPAFSMANGHPAYADLAPGGTYVFALTPRGSRWQLIADEGWGLVVP